jgi:hypothetical protein
VNLKPLRLRRRRIRIDCLAGWCGAWLLASTGCAIQYYDPKTGAEHLWGFGHLRLKVQPPAGAVSAVVAGQETFGFGAGTTAAGGHLAVGWRDERRIVVNPTNASVRLEWPDADFLKVRVGSDPPFASRTNNTNASR